MYGATHHGFLPRRYLSLAVLAVGDATIHDCLLLLRASFSTVTLVAAVYMKLDPSRLPVASFSVLRCCMGESLAIDLERQGKILTGVTDGMIRLHSTATVYCVHG